MHSQRTRGVYAAVASAVTCYSVDVRVAVVGHVEWVEFVNVDRVPGPGDIVHGDPTLAVPAGGGAVAAVQLARFGAQSLFFTALGDDALGHRADDELRARGVQLHTTFRREPQRRALTLIDPQRDRTIIVIGARLTPRGADPLPWDELASCDAVYVTAGDLDAIRHARRARVVVATSRILPALREAGIQVDALVGSDNDPGERYAPGDLPLLPHLVVRTDGGRGGYALLPDGTRQRYAAVPTTVTGDTYGAGDTFAAGLAFALGERRPPTDAIAFAAARAAEVVAFHGPYPPGRP
jgi:ribokinase